MYDFTHQAELVIQTEDHALTVTQMLEAKLRLAGFDLLQVLVAKDGLETEEQALEAVELLAARLERNGHTMEDISDMLIKVAALTRPEPAPLRLIAQADAG